MKNLIGNTSFGNYLNTLEIDNCEYRIRRNKFDIFLSLKLEIWQFVPCKLVDGVWMVLSKPKGYDSYINWEVFNPPFEEYKQAKERCLFEGFELNQKDVSKLKNIICITKNKIQITFFKKENGIFLDDLTTNETFETRRIEGLVPHNLELTPTALKQLGL